MRAIAAQLLGHDRCPWLTVDASHVHAAFVGGSEKPSAKWQLSSMSHWLEPKSHQELLFSMEVEALPAPEQPLALWAVEPVRLFTPEGDQVFILVSVSASVSVSSVSVSSL